MKYDKDFWNKYADENESRNNEGFTKFLTDLASSLHCTSILEIGCGTGIDLRRFNDSFEIHGVDLNDHALELAKKISLMVNFTKKISQNYLLKIHL